MFTRYILKNMKRSVVTNVLFSLLLVTAGALFALSAGLWVSVYRSEKNLDEIITTIAITDIYAIRRYVRDAVVSGDLSQFTDESGQPLESHRERFSSKEKFQEFATPLVYRQVVGDISERVYSSGLLRMDDRRIYGAYSENIKSVVYYINKDTQNTVSFVLNSPQSIAAFVVECTGVDEVFEWYPTVAESTLIRSIVADFRVERNLYVHHGRPATLSVTGYFPYMNPDGSFPVETGKRYVVEGFAFYQSADDWTNNPPWYNALPPKRHMPNAFYVDLLGDNYEIVEAFSADSMAGLSENIRPLLGVQGVTSKTWPIKVLDRIPVFDPAAGNYGVTWFELSGSLEDALESERGEYISKALSVARVSHHSLTVITTDDLNSVLRFNQRTNRVTSGRGITPADAETGARVCVVSELLAADNGFSVGDKIALQLYLTTLGRIPTETRTTAWIPNPYHPDLELTEPIEFEIVGLYSSLRQEQNDHAVSSNAVFIPSASFDGVSGAPVVRMESEYDPPLLDTIIVPNDKVEETRALIDDAAEGYGAFFRFYDQGYSTFKPVLANLRFGMTWIAVFSAAGWAIAVMMFLLFYVGRKRDEAALLTAIGVSRKKCFRWVFAQCAIVILLAQGVVLAGTSVLFGRILDEAISFAVAFTESFRDFSLSEMNIAGGLQIALPLDKTALGLLLSSAIMSLALLALSACMSARAATRRWGTRGD